MIIVFFLSMQRKPTSFEQSVYDITKNIPRGNVTTYKEIAHTLGTRAYRAVGNALNRNPFAPHVPCHRVVCSDGHVGGFAQGRQAKIKLLCSEGIQVDAGKVRDFEEKKISSSMIKKRWPEKRRMSHCRIISVRKNNNKKTRKNQD